MKLVEQLALKSTDRWLPVIDTPYLRIKRLEAREWYEGGFKDGFKAAREMAADLSIQLEQKIPIPYHWKKAEYFRALGEEEVNGEV